MPRSISAGATWISKHGAIIETNDKLDRQPCRQVGAGGQLDFPVIMRVINLDSERRKPMVDRRVGLARPFRRSRPSDRRSSFDGEDDRRDLNYTLR